MNQVDKLRQTNIKKYGSLEAYKEHMRNIGSKGGKNSKGHEFAHGKLDPAKLGKIGAEKRYGNRKTL